MNCLPDFATRQILSCCWRGYASSLCGLLMASWGVQALVAAWSVGVLPECRSPNSDLNMWLLGLTAVHQALAFQVQHADVRLQSSQLFLCWKPLMWCSRAFFAIFDPNVSARRSLQIIVFCPPVHHLQSKVAEHGWSGAERTLGVTMQTVRLRPRVLQGDNFLVANFPDGG